MDIRRKPDGSPLNDLEALKELDMKKLGEMEELKLELAEIKALLLQLVERQ